MKFFRAIVKVESTVELNIQADDESTAQEKARRIALEQVSGRCRVTDVELSLVSQSALRIGSKVKHKDFGIGIIKALAPLANGNGDKGWMATVEFESQGAKHISLMPGRQLLIGVDA